MAGPRRRSKSTDCRCAGRSASAVPPHSTNVRGTDASSGHSERCAVGSVSRRGTKLTVEAGARVVPVRDDRTARDARSSRIDHPGRPPVRPQGRSGMPRLQGYVERFGRPRRCRIASADTRNAPDRHGPVPASATSDTGVRARRERSRRARFSIRRSSRRRDIRAERGPLSATCSRPSAACRRRTRRCPCRTGSRTPSASHGR